MRLEPVNPIQAHAGFLNEGYLHLDLFMHVPKNPDLRIDLESYSKFNAVYDPKFNWTVLFKKNQATKLGIDLSKLKKYQDTGSYEDQKILFAPIVIDLIIPMMKNSTLELYKFTHPIHEVQVINIDENNAINQDRVIIGRRFKECLNLIINDEMKDTMGICGNKTFAKTIGKADLEFWEGDIEALGLNQALKFSGKNLMVGNVNLPDLKDIKLWKENENKENMGFFYGDHEKKTGEDMSCKISASKETKYFGLNPAPQSNKTDFTISSQDLLKLQNTKLSKAQDKKNQEEKNSEDEKKQEDDVMKEFSKGKQKKLKKKKTQAKIGEAQSLIFQVLEQSAEWKQEKFKSLSRLLTNLLSLEVTTAEKQDLISKNFQETEAGLELKDNL